MLAYIPAPWIRHGIHINTLHGDLAKTLIFGIRHDFLPTPAKNAHDPTKKKVWVDEGYINIISIL